MSTTTKLYYRYFTEREREREREREKGETRRVQEHKNRHPLPKVFFSWLLFFPCCHGCMLGWVCDHLFSCFLAQCIPVRSLGEATVGSKGGKSV